MFHKLEYNDQAYYVLTNNCQYPIANARNNRIDRYIYYN